MQWRNTEDKWGAGAKLFHWVLALGVLCMIALGWSADLWPLSPTKFQLFTIHKLLGLSIFVLMILRLLWRLLNPTPILPPSLVGWERFAAQATHWLLYGIVLMMPISGYVVNSAANFPIDVFGLFEVPLLVPPNPEVQEKASSAHEFGFWVLAGLLVLHVGAALRHHFILRDNILKRMLPGA